jgi:hypothetical protein
MRRLLALTLIRNVDLCGQLPEPAFSPVIAAEIEDPVFASGDCPMSEVVAREGQEKGKVPFE